MHYLMIICAVILLSACDGEPKTSINRDIVGDNAASYTELSEVSNDVFENAELTNYTLDANGIKISGKFEETNPSVDHYRFYTGLNSAVDIQVILDGRALDTASGEMNTSLNAYIDDGLSTLHGLNSAKNATVTPASFFVIYVAPFDANGQSYTIQMRSAQ